MPALSAPRAGKAVGEDAALEVTAELPLDMGRNRPVVIMAFEVMGEPGREVFLMSSCPCRSTVLRSSRLLG